MVVLDAGQEQVWNLSVGQVHEYVANGILVHNSIRNAAMRFGVALNLWSKGLLESEALDNVRPEPTATNGSGATPPFYAQFGYADADEMTSVNDSLKDILHAVGNEERATVRAWCIEHGYTTTDDGGTVMAVPLPVRKGHVEEYRAILVAARDLTSRNSTRPGNTAAERAERGEVQTSTETAPGLTEPPATPDPAETGTPDLPTPETNAEEPPELLLALDAAVGKVRPMKQPERKDELRKRGLPVTGNNDDLGRRLARALAEEAVAGIIPNDAPF